MLAGFNRNTHVCTLDSICSQDVCNEEAAELRSGRIIADVFLCHFFPKLLFLKFHGVHVPQSGMTPPTVVKHFYVINDVLPGGRSTEIRHPKDLLNLETTEKTLRHSIIPAIAFPAHAGQYSMILE